MNHRSLDFRFGQVASVTCLLLSLLGCRSDLVEPNEESGQEMRPAASLVPLRIWIAAPVADVEQIQRKWIADSDQPIDVRVLEPQELLSLEKCRCDVLIYPARLAGELLHREWIVKIPEALRGPASKADESEPSAVPTAPRVWAAQADYGGEQIAVSLGGTLPIFVASPSLLQQIGDSARPTWETLLPLLDQVDVMTELPSEPDLDALVDRFFAVAATLSHRNSKYGLLFELRTMKPMLTQPEYEQAAQILLQLARQTRDGASILGSHSRALEIASQSEQDVLAIASASLIGEEAAKLHLGGVVKTRSPTDGEQPDSGNATAWNTGGGLVASLAFDCSQTSQSSLFLRWLAQGTTRSFLARTIPGIDAASPTGNADTLSWKAQQESLKLLSSPSIPQEPRLPGAHALRQALAEELLRFLRGEITARAALSAASQRWETIVREQGASQADYERSLNLTL